MRNKTVKLFNKNHITLERTILGGKPSNYYKSKYVPKKTKVVEKESPLGFVYLQI